MFCKHSWKLISETVTKSGLEQLLDSGKRIEGAKGYSDEKKYILTVACDKCGKLKQFVNEA